MQGTLFAFQLNTLWPHWTLGQFVLGHIGHSLEVIVASVAEMRGAKAEKDGHRTAIPALVFQVICTVLRAHLSPRDIAAASAHQFFRVIVITLSSICIALGFTSEVSLAAFETDVVGVPLQCEADGIVVEPGPLGRHGLAFAQPLILQPHEGLFLDVFIQRVDGRQVGFERHVSDFGLANGAIPEAEGDPGPGPSLLQDLFTALIMKHMAAF